MPASKLSRIAIHIQPPRKTMSFSKLAMTIFATLALVAFSASAFAQQLDRLGLKQQWFTHSGVSAGGKLADWYLDIDPNKATTYFEIVGGDYSETFSENALGPNGTPVGIEFGLELANIKAEVIAARLKSDTGKEVAVNVNQYSLPESTLYTQTDNGIVRSINAETGKIRWSQSIGRSTSESIGVAGKGDYVAVVKGVSVYCLDSETGAVLWSKRCESAPSAPPEIYQNLIFVPLIDGRVERFDINTEGFNSIAYISGGSGAVTTRVAISPLSICWPNYSGVVSVVGLNANKGKPAFQLNAEGSVFGMPQYKNGIYFITSIDNYIYALSEQRGSLMWENSTGFEITQAPFVLGNNVYVINDLNQLARFDAETGLLSAQWQKPRPNVGTFVGASRTKIFTVDKAGQMKVLDQESGAVLGAAPVGQVAKVLPNTKNDRIYLLNRAGTIRCFRELSSVKPFFHSDEFIKKTISADESNKDNRPGPDEGDPFGGDGNDPFGGDDNSGAGAGDPFGGDDNSGAGAGDPFGGDDNSGAGAGDPFGGDDDSGAGASDPFGGDDDAPAGESDPFGGDDDSSEGGDDDPFG